MKAYKKAGVDLAAADEAVQKLKPLAKRTLRPEVMSGLGGFGGLFSLEKSGYKNPVLVSGTDGVGTKLKLAFELDRHDSIGIDLVAMCVNDILVQGAEPLFFLDYLACGKLLPEQVESIVGGISEGCIQSGAALLGGETAEMPGTYHKNEYDLVGVATGVVDKKNIIDGSKTKSGSVVLGLPSNGLHTNGYSLARKLIFDTLGLSPRDALPNQKTAVEHALLAPHKNYSKAINGLIDDGQNIEGIAHITGGGLIDNIPRILPDGLAAEISVGAWKKIPIFKFLANNLDLSTKELYRTFNMGIGLALVVEESKKSTMMRALENEGCVEIGKIITGPSKEVHLNEQ